MINDIRNVPVCLSPNSQNYCFENTIITGTSVEIKDQKDNKSLYKYTISSDDTSNNYRALKWTNIQTKESDYVLYAKNNDNNNTMLIYQCNQPQIMDITSDNCVYITFWTNFKETITDYKKDSIIYVDQKTKQYKSIPKTKGLFLAKLTWLKQGLKLKPFCYDIKLIKCYENSCSFDFCNGQNYNGFFKIQPTQTPKSFSVKDPSETHGSGIVFINDKMFEMPVYNFTVSSQITYILLKSILGTDGTPTQPVFQIATTKPETKQQQCFIIIGIVKIKTEKEQESITYYQQSYGVPHGFIYGKCQDQQGESQEQEQQDESQETV